MSEIFKDEYDNEYPVLWAEPIEPDNELYTRLIVCENHEDIIIFFRTYVYEECDQPREGNFDLTMAPETAEAFGLGLVTAVKKLKESP